MNNRIDIIEFKKLSLEEIHKLLEDIGPKEALYVVNFEEIPLTFKPFDKYVRHIPLDKFLIGDDYYDIDGEGYLATNIEQSNKTYDDCPIHKVKEKYPWCTHIAWYDENK
jgi:hypothetical protein